MKYFLLVWLTWAVECQISSLQLLRLTKQSSASVSSLSSLQSRQSAAACSRGSVSSRDTDNLPVLHTTKIFGDFNEKYLVIPIHLTASVQA